MRNEIVITPVVSLIATFCVFIFGAPLWLGLVVFVSTPVLFLAACWTLRAAIVALRREKLRDVTRQPRQVAGLK